MPEDAERKGLGTPATRAAILEKLVAGGYVERRKAKKKTFLLPTALGKALITLLPATLQSPRLTAEWENRLKQIEHGAPPTDFIEGIQIMLKDLVRTYSIAPGTELLFGDPRSVVGKCPRCGKNVKEWEKGFSCEDRKCGFVLWKNNFFFERKGKQLTREIVAELLQDGRTFLQGCYSERTGKRYDAFVVLTDDGQKAGYRIEFPNDT